MKLREMPNTVVHCRTKDEYDRLMTIYEKSQWSWSKDMKMPPDGWKERGERALFVEVEDHWCRYMRIHGELVLSLSDFLREQGISEELKPEDLKVGDWVEVMEEFVQSDKPFMQGERYRLVGKSGSSMVLLDVSSRNDMQICQGGDTWEKGWYIFREHLDKIRKCEAPQESKIIVESSPSRSFPYLKLRYDTTPSKYVIKTESDFSVSFIPSPSPLMDCCTSIVRKARDLALSPMERKYRKLNLKDEDGLTEQGQHVLLDLLFQKFGKELMDPVVKKLASKENDCDDE